MSGSTTETAKQLLRDRGTTYAAEAGITLRDKPAPLYQLLVLTTLSSAPIAAEIAVSATKELLAAGWRTPQRMRDATWQQRVDALGRGSYRRYDESTSRTLQAGADWLLQEHQGDLRRLTPTSKDDVASLREAIAEAPGIGPTGADIFCREVQAIWPTVRPFFDRRALVAAKRLDLPTTRISSPTSSPPVSSRRSRPPWCAPAENARPKRPHDRRDTRSVASVHPETGSPR